MRGELKGVGGGERNGRRGYVSETAVDNDYLVSQVG